LHNTDHQATALSIYILLLILNFNLADMTIGCCTRRKCRRSHVAIYERRL